MTRIATKKRETNETSVLVDLDLDGAGTAEVSTGLPFFDHMLDQLARHGGFDLKVLAAGALPPKEGFRYAFESGADFICVGMYDFQVVEDVNLALEVLQGPITRERVWRA